MIGFTSVPQPTHIIAPSYLAFPSNCFTQHSENPRVCEQECLRIIKKPKKKLEEKQKTPTTFRYPPFE